MCCYGKRETFVELAKARAGNNSDPDVARNELMTSLDKVERNINVAIEAYPDLKAHAEIRDVLQQNSYLQQEITAAREVYNDAVNRWNTEIFSRWAKRFVAAKNGYTTRIPFIASVAVKEAANGVFF